MRFKFSKSEWAGTRRSLLAWGAAIITASGQNRRAVALRSIKVGKPIPVAESQGDTWAITAAENGAMYSASDDSHGFRGAANSNVCFNRITGTGPFHLSGTTVNPLADYGKAGQKGPDGCTWKSSGCLYLDGDLYLVVARHRYGEDSGDPFRRQTAQNASIIRSADFGRTWTRPEQANYNDPLFPGSRFATPYFIDEGARGGSSVDDSDRYVYAISNNGFWDCGDNFVIGRVLRSRMRALTGSDWEYYGGPGKHSWSPEDRDAQPIIQAKGKCGMTGAAYLPAYGRYLLVSWYYPAGGGKMPQAATHTVWNFFEAPRPWGVWTQIDSFESKPNGFYSPQMFPLFRSANQVFVATAGNWDDRESYRLTLVPLTISVS